MVKQVEGEAVSPELLAFAQDLADAVRNYYVAAQVRDGHALQQVQLYCEPADPEPLSALVLVLPGSLEADKYLSDVRDASGHIFAWLQDWLYLEEKYGSTKPR